MIYRTILILCIILCSCESDEHKIYSITITGIVSDQVTGEPIEGATVYVGVQPGAMPGDNLVSIKSSTVSATNGQYILSTQSESFKDLSSVPIGQRGLSIAVIASKQGYTGCHRREIYYYNAQNSVLNIEMYH